MSGIIDIVVLFSLIGCFSIIIFKLWNLINILVRKQEGYEGLWVFVTMAGYLIFWVFLLQILSTDPATNNAINGIYRLSFTLSTAFMTVAAMLTIIEVLLKFTVLGEQIKAKPTYRERGVSLPVFK